MKRTPPRPHESRRDRRRRRAAAGRAAFELERRLPRLLPYGCAMDPRCLKGYEHNGDCALYEPWDGMPDPHRHNPLGVAVALAAVMVIVLGFALLVLEAIRQGVFW